MSQTNMSTDSFSSPGQASGNDRTVSQSELELACINLISQLEMQVESAKTHSSHVEQAGENTDKLLNELLRFCEEHFQDDRLQRSVDAIEKASYASLAHREVLNTRSWGFAIRNLFGSPACSDESVRQTYEKLGEALTEACTAVLAETVLLVGPETECGKTIQQSTAVFVDELKASW